MFRLEWNPRDVRKIESMLVEIEGKIREYQGDVRVDAEKYKQNLIGAIYEQKYAGSYPKYSKGYAEKKAREGRDPRFWIYEGKVLDAIKAVAIKRISVGGYMVSLKLPGYAEYNEEMRPLFSPTYEVTLMEYSKKYKRIVKEMQRVIRSKK